MFLLCISLLSFWSQSCTCRPRQAHDGFALAITTRDQKLEFECRRGGMTFDVPLSTRIDCNNNDTQNPYTQCSPHPFEEPLLKLAVLQERVQRERVLWAKEQREIPNFMWVPSPTTIEGQMRGQHMPAWWCTICGSFAYWLSLFAGPSRCYVRSIWPCWILLWRKANIFHFRGKGSNCSRKYAMAGRELGRWPGQRALQVPVSWPLSSIPRNQS